MAKKVNDGFDDDDGFDDPPKKKAVVDDGFDDEPIKPLPEIKSPYWELPKKSKDASVKNVLGEFTYRGRRVIHTDDDRYTKVKTWGIQMPSVFVVRDDFDEYCLPVGEDVFFTPHEAIAAIEMMDNILPTIRKEKTSRAESLEYAYREMRIHYRTYYAVHHALQQIEVAVFASHRTKDDVRQEIFRVLNGLRQQINSNRRIQHT